MKYEILIIDNADIKNEQDSGVTMDSVQQRTTAYNSVQQRTTAYNSVQKRTTNGGHLPIAQFDEKLLRQNKNAFNNNIAQHQP